MLLRRPHGEEELRRKLAERGHGEEAVDGAVERMQELVRRMTSSMTSSFPTVSIW